MKGYSIQPKTPPYDLLIWDMGFLESHDLNHWQLWTPLIGGLILYIGLRVRIIEIEDEE